MFQRLFCSSELFTYGESVMEQGGSQHETLFLKIGASPAPPSHYGISHNESKISNAVSLLTCSLSFVILQKTKIVRNKEDMIRERCGQNTTIKH